MQNANLLNSVRQIFPMYSRYLRRPRMSVLGIYDPTAVMNGDEMDRNKREGFIKLALYLFNFFGGLLWYVLAHWRSFKMYPIFEGYSIFLLLLRSFKSSYSINKK